jgi:hypothetical protein
MTGRINQFLLLSWVCVLQSHCTVVSGLETNRSCYCVTEDDSEDFNSDLCSECSSHDLSYFADTGAFNSSYSTFYFSLGHHSLFRGVTVSQNATNVTDLTLIGLTNTSIIDLCGKGRTPAAVVQCEGNTGFLFANVINLTIAGLEFRNCGFSVNVSSYKHSAAIALVSVWNLTMCNVQILFSNGWGLLGESVSGTSSINYSVFDGSHSVGSTLGGGNLYLSYRPLASQDTSFTIAHCIIRNGHNNFSHGDGGGMFIYIDTMHHINILVDTVHFSDNVGKHGGNVALAYEAVHGTWQSTVKFVNCYFLNGTAELGGGIYITMGAYSDDSLIPKFSIPGLQCHPLNSSQNYLPVHISYSHIANNTASEVGAGVYIQLHEDVNFQSVAKIEFKWCVLDNNSNNNISHRSRGGTAVNIINFHLPGFDCHQSPQYNVVFAYCNFTRNRGAAVLADSVGSGTLYVEENALLVLKHCWFENNNCTGITAVHSNIVLEGKIVLRNNRAFNGGGMVMCANSIIFLNLSREVKVIIENCHADNFGGGVYAEFECSQAIPPCFFQTSNSRNISKHLIYLQNNTATRAGTAVYGGAVDYCYAFGPYNKSDKSVVFNKLFHIDSASENILSNVSSNPINVCFCTNGTPACKDTRRISEEQIYPGGLLSVTVVVVGQRNGTVPGLVVATSLDNNVTIEGETDRVINSTSCTTLNYTLLTSIQLPHSVKIDFTIGNTDFRNAIIDTGIAPVLTVTIASCPYGFSVSTKSGKCDCNSWVHSLHAICNITTNSIYRSRNSSWWIGQLKNTSNTAIYSTFCPFDYCVRKDIGIQINESGFADSQCANNRRGILCGGCKGNRSNVLGSSSCKDCRSPHSILKMLGLILLFALLGIAFVFLVGILDMTVSEGTLNAIVFYMNVVRVNTNIFFDSPKGKSTVSRMLEVFVAWMNLDLGIETCFYDGMGTIGKTALQLVFPLYLCLLSWLIIFLSRRSSIVTKLFGKNVVKILATIIFHFYAKILRTVIDILRRSEIMVEGEDSHTQHVSSYRWTVDGTIPYLNNRRHTVLFAVAVIVIAVTLPYTLALLFIQCLRRRSNMKVLFWVNKLKPFFDAYTGPYKDNYHFWTGFLLVVRIVLFIAIAVNTSKGEVLNLTLINTTTAILFVLIRPGIYKSWVLNLIEVFTYANLAALTSGTVYDSWLKYSNKYPITLCVGSMFLLFCGIVVYHILKKLSVTRRWGLMKVWLLDRRWPWMKRKQIRSLILPYVDPDNDEDLSSSDSELDPILQNAPPVARYDQYREPLIGTTRTE